MTWVVAGAGGGGKTSGWEEWEACGRSVLRGESERHTSAVDGTVGIAGSGRLGVGVGVIVDNICSFVRGSLVGAWRLPFLFPLRCAGPLSCEGPAFLVLLRSWQPS